MSKVTLNSVCHSFSYCIHTDIKCPEQGYYPKILCRLHPDKQEPPDLSAIILWLLSQNGLLF